MCLPITQTNFPQHGKHLGMSNDLIKRTQEEHQRVAKARAGPGGLVGTARCKRNNVDSPPPDGLIAWLRAKAKPHPELDTRGRFDFSLLGLGLGPGGEAAKDEEGMFGGAEVVHARIGHPWQRYLYTAGHLERRKETPAWLREGLLRFRKDNLR